MNKAWMNIAIEPAQGYSWLASKFSCCGGHGLRDLSSQEGPNVAHLWRLERLQ